MRLAVAGVLGIGVAYGFARYGFGLFLPRLREEFGLSLTLVGAIGSAAYAGYLAALVLAGTASGWAWAPYSDAVDRTLPAARRAGAAERARRSALTGGG